MPATRNGRRDGRRPGGQNNGKKRRRQARCGRKPEGAKPFKGNNSAVSVASGRPRGLHNRTDPAELLELGMPPRRLKVGD